VTSTPQPSDCAEGIAGVIEADNGFCPSRDGFTFSNFSDMLDPSSEVLIDMYSADMVCKKGTISLDGLSCDVDLSVRKLIASKQNTLYGAAYGMAVAVLRLYQNRYESPMSFDPAAQQTGQLTLSEALRTYLHRLSAGAYSARSDVGTDYGYVRASPLPELLDRLSEQLQNVPAVADPYVLLLYSPSGSSSLAVTPYRVVNLDNSHYEVYVYDSNFPGDDSRRVTFDLSAGIWSYSTLAPGSNTPIDLSGAVATNPLPDLRLLSAHALRGLIMLGMGAETDQDGVTRSLFESGNPVAYQTENCHSLTVAGTVVVSAESSTSEESCTGVLNTGDHQSLAFNDGLGAEENNRAHNRLYGLRDADVFALKNANTPAENLQFDLVGQQGSGNLQLDFLTDQGDLTQVNAQPSTQTRAAGITAIHYGLSLSPDASQVSLVPASPTGADVAIVASLGFAERGQTENQPSSSIDLTDLQLLGGQPLQSSIDGNTGLLTVSSDRPVTFSLAIEMLAPDGSADLFKRSNWSVDGAAAQLDFGSWQGGDAPLSIVVDEAGDGFANDLPQELENESNNPPTSLPEAPEPGLEFPLFLPFIQQTAAQGATTAAGAAAPSAQPVGPAPELTPAFPTFLPLIQQELGRIQQSLAPLVASSVLCVNGTLCPDALRYPATLLLLFAAGWLWRRPR